MPQKRYWNFEDDDDTKSFIRWLTGVLSPGVYHGFDFNPTANMNLNLVHSTTGFKDVDDTETESAFQGLVITRQGTVIKEDGAIAPGTISNGDATHPRIDIVVLTHTYSATTGGVQALYSIIEGTPAASPVAPALSNALTQIKIGELLVPAGTTQLDDVGVIWTRNALFSPDRVTVTNSEAKQVSSAITASELNTLEGINTGMSIQDQLDGKQATITGAITTVLSSNLSVARVVVTDGSGKITTSANVDITELNALNNSQGKSVVTSHTDGRLFRVHRVDIPAWNMVADKTKAVTHSIGGTDFLKIRSVSVIVKNDANTKVYDYISALSNPEPEGHIMEINSTQILLEHIEGGTFDSISAFGSTSDIRGWITFLLEF